MTIDEYLKRFGTQMNAIETEFVTQVFYPYAGELGLSYLNAQTPFEDSEFRKRKLDFTVETDKYKYVIEIDGYSYHAEGARFVSLDYFDELLVKQNDLILSGWKLLRFSYNQVRNKAETCMDTLRRAFKSDPCINPIFAGKSKLQPTKPQRDALESIEFFRNQGKKKGVVILPTGIGKTFLAAFDARTEDKRTLFIAHQSNILQQAHDSFEIVWPLASKGFFDATQKDDTSQVIFASKDTLYRDNNLEMFDPHAFDYVIIDEVHHSASMTYRKIINHFKPSFMLGMTATPDRQDRADILELFGYNKFFEMGQRYAIEAGYLTGFKYYGLQDDIDYKTIKHSGRRYDASDLGRKLNIRKRNDAIYSKFTQICPSAKALGFCVTIEHAITMAECFDEKGISAAAIHSDRAILSVQDRNNLVEDFRSGKIQVLFTVDMFNEGVDFPDVEALLFLRPTESKRIFTQQLGRGLRLSPYKEHVIVLDFIGNFVNADRIQEYLRGSQGGNQPPGTAGAGRKFGTKDFLDWPLGCEVKFDESVSDMFKSMEENKREITKEDLSGNYFNVKELLKRKPVRADMNNLDVSSYRIGAYERAFDSWNGFLKEIGEATLASYHYPQGTHLGHVFYVVKSVGDGTLDDRLHEETYSPRDGGVTELGRQTRYKVWACMELDLLLDDRQADSLPDAYQHLTEAGVKVCEILNRHVKEDDFYAFSTEGKVDISWNMVHGPKFYNEFVASLPQAEKGILRKIFFEMDAVQHMTKYLFHATQNRKTLQRSDIYSNYFNTPFVRQYFEMNGIEQGSEEGAKRRLPFLLNILEAFGVISSIGASNIQLNVLPKMEWLFGEENETQWRNLRAVEEYYTMGCICADVEVLVELKTLFGEHFLTPDYMNIDFQ